MAHCFGFVEETSEQIKVSNKFRLLYLKGHINGFTTCGMASPRLDQTVSQKRCPK